MKKLRYNLSSLVLLSLLTAPLSSCDSWLSVQPKDQVEDTELLSTESGYKEALAGVYSSMVNSSTYSKELLFGTIGVLGQEWDNVPSSYTDVVTYDYDAATPTSLIANIWSTSYNSIANVNNLLKYIDDDEALFSRNNYAIIKGEALALRAFLHFDLVRCFGVSYEVNPNMPAIPYPTEFTYRVYPQLTVKQVVEEHILPDLLAAEELLKVDPILTGETITELTDNGYLLNRQMHLNYYAVKALEARVYMYAQKYQEALAAANVVLNSNQFEWATEENLRKGYDNSLATEQVFGLNNVNLSTLGDTYFNEDYNSYSFSLTEQTQLNYYDNQTADLRYLYLFKSGETGTYIDNRYLTKFVQSGSSDSYYLNKMPLIRFSELLLIKSEVNYRLSGTGLDELNELRAARNVAQLETLPDDYYDELIREYRREFLGEGQFFFLLKRLNRATIPNSDVDPITQKVYTFPLPISETEVAQREDNR